MTPGPRNLITDIAGLRVGNAQDATINTGASVLTSDAPFTASVAIMGGAPGTRETDLLEPDKSVDAVDALVLSGGSAFGLDAGAGVMDALHADGRGFPVGDMRVPIVPAAILFDLLNGGDKAWPQNPYRNLGHAAYQTASPDFALGRSGAGFGATTATGPGGLGSASLVLDSGITVGALVAANPLGNVTTPGGTHFWAAPFEMNGEFGGFGADTTPGIGAQPLPLKFDLHITDRANTTIAIVATDAALTKSQAKRVATAAHDGIARAVMPAHTPMDGDLVFAAATGARALGDPTDVLHIGHAAAICLARAIARAVFEASNPR